MQDVGRYLLFSGAQADGLPAQLHALRLGVAACAEASEDNDKGQLWQGLIAEHSKLLAKANLTEQAAEARSLSAAVHVLPACWMVAEGKAAVGTGDCTASEQAGSKAGCPGRQGSAAGQGTAATQQEHADSGVAGSASRRREISVPCKERKRDAGGSFKQQQRMAGGGNGSGYGGLPPAGPGRNAGNPYRQQPQQHQGPDEIEDDEEEDEGFVAGANGGGGSRAGATPFQQIMRQGHGQAAAAADAAAGGGGEEGSCVGGAGRPGFMSARTQLVTDLRKKGQHQQANRFNQAAPRTGLTRPRGSGRQAGGGAAGAGRGGFVPPFVGKAIENHTGGGGGGAAASANGAGGEEGPLSARTLEMLGVPPEGELPPELARHDPKLIEQVCNEVIDASGGVAWEDIAGLETAKHLIKEIVVWPMLNPQIFTGPRAPPKGILLFGPPGTGKTLIGKAVASNIRAAFFSISASSLTSKWIGEGEKMVKTLFAVAGVMQPSVIFIDEIDSILSARKPRVGEHEASRRLKTEMLVQMEGCDPTSSSRRVLLVGATNRPEELDEAARRRMPKQLYIPLPCAEARRQLVVRQLGPDAKVAADLSDADLDKVVAKTDGYSGSDMRNLIQEACQGPVRDAVARVGEAVATLSDADLRPVRVKDFQHAAKAQRASVTTAEIERYEAYNDRHGAKYVLQQQEGHAGDGPESDDDDW
ncbi:fidgetin-like protein 1-like protein [Scenedesmus sp. NREL 46B-D3]|nr:fidgetin-like protein 1-like protein [Scenedesmus sp. NREL 46B-D3]